MQFRRRRKVADLRILCRLGDHAGQILGAGHIARRKSGGIDKPGAVHADELCARVHRIDECTLPAGVAAPQCRRRAIVRRHQRQPHQVFTPEGAADGKARAGALDGVDVRCINHDGIIHSQFGIEYHHRRHDLGDRRDGHRGFSVLGKQFLATDGVKHHRGMGKQVGLTLFVEIRGSGLFCNLGFLGRLRVRKRAPANRNCGGGEQHGGANHSFQHGSITQLRSEGVTPYQTAGVSGKISGSGSQFFSNPLIFRP